jgi:hypothetical protein
MTRKATDTLARMRAAAGGRASAPAGPVVPKAPVTKYTVLLTEEKRAALRMFALQHRVDASALFRTFVALLEEDPELASRVIERSRRT